MSAATYGDRIVASGLSQCRRDFVRARLAGWGGSALSPLVAGMAIGKAHLAVQHFDADPLAVMGACNEVLWMLSRSRELRQEAA